jgi:hypothetical protein
MVTVTVTVYGSRGSISWPNYPIFPFCFHLFVSEMNPSSKIYPISPIPWHLALRLYFIFIFCFILFFPMYRLTSPTQPFCNSTCAEIVSDRFWSAPEIASKYRYAPRPCEVIYNLFTRLVQTLVAREPSRPRCSPRVFSTVRPQGRASRKKYNVFIVIRAECITIFSSLHT